MPKSPKNRKSKPLFGASNRLRIPFTPLRRFFFKLELLAPSPNVPIFLGKRRREELSEREAGFEHLHAYDHTSAVERELDSHQGNAEAGSSTPINVYTPDGSRSRTKKPAGPRSLRPLRRQAPADLTFPKNGGSQSTVTSPCTTPRPLHYTRRKGSACLALQNVDASLDDDAVIITALDNIPFNSHEDLLAMSREELIRVAQDLNAKLPRALSIDIGNERPITFIRNDIEVLVGIRPDVPAAPRRTGVKKMSSDNPRFFEEFSFEEQLEMGDSTPTTTPLSLHIKPKDWPVDLHEMLHVPRRLERLDELTEEDSSRGEDGTWRKKRRLSSGTESTQELGSSILMRNRLEDGFILTPDLVGLPVSGSNRLHETSTPLSSSSRILRSHSQKLLERSADVISTPLVLSEPKHNGKSKRKSRPKYRRQTRKRSKDNKRNSITFPTVNSVSTDVPSEPSTASHGLAETSSECAAYINMDGIVSSDTGTRSLHQSEYSANNSGSPFLSIKSTFSSMSKMSICTRSTRGSTAAMSMGETRSVNMDISL